MENVFDFRSWIKDRNNEEYTLQIEDDDHYRLVTDYGRAEINFYPDEIVEISITSFKNNDPKYYLHFQLKEEEHTKVLFREMEEALLNLRYEKKIRVLLSCSSGFTTSFFASRLKEAADTLELDYTFDAVSYFDLYDQAENYDIILLAPQIGYMLKKIATSLPNKLILQIPTQVFASYDAMSTLEFIQEKMKKKCDEKAKKKKKVGKHACSKKKQTVLCLAELYDGEQVTLYMRIYDHGTIVLDDYVIKATSNLIPIWDTIDYCLSQAPHIDLIALAYPGVVNEEGVIDYPEQGYKNYRLKEHVETRYQIPTLVMNNTNAAVVGYHVNHPQYQNITFHSQPYGHLNGGQGNMVNGQLVTGIQGVAGELKYYLYRMQFSDEPRRLARTEQGQIELVINALLPTIALFGPEIVLLRTPMVNDMHALEKRLETFIPLEYMPKLEFIAEANELIFEGLLEYGGVYYQNYLVETQTQQTATYAA